MKRGRLRAALLAFVLVGAAGCGGGAPPGDAAPVGAAPSADGGAEQGPTPGDRAGADTGAPARGVPTLPAAAGAGLTSTPTAEHPARIAIPAVGIDSPLVDLGLRADGALEVPADFARAGWFDRGPAPGARGPAVIAGHVDSRSGPAAFYRLGELRPGDTIIVIRRDGVRVRFTVDGVRRYSKDAFPTASVYGPVPGPVLRLVTCGGEFARASGHYRDNVVVYAS